MTARLPFRSFLVRGVARTGFALFAALGLPPASAQPAAETIIARFDGTTGNTVQTLGGTERVQRFEFDLPAGDNARLTITLNWDNAPATNLGLELFDAAGTRLAAAVSSNAAEQIVTVEQPRAGGYRAVVTETRTTAGTDFHLVAYALRARAETTACEAAYAGLDADGRPVRVDPQLAYGAPGTLILTFPSDAARDRGASLLRAAAFLGDEARAAVRAYDRLPVVTLPVPVITAALVDALARQLASARLLGIYPDRPLTLALETSTAVIRAPQARASYGLTGRGIGVAVIDTGIDTTHGDFANVALNVKLIPLAGVAVPVANGDTSTGHGTHVASTVGGTGAISGGRFTGVAPGATLLGLGAGDGLHITAVLEAWNYLLDPDVYLAHNVRVTNNSYGSGPGDFDPANPINLATKRAYDKGMVSVFAAGNDGDIGDGLDTVNQEALSPCVIGVAAGQRDGTLANFSSRGVAGDPLKHPDLTAPGVEIAAARAATGVVVTALYPKFPDNDPRYVTLNGTSMASPHVAGVVALLLEASPLLSFEQVLATLEATARPMFDAAGRRYAPHEVGAGYVDALAAIAQARGETPPPDSDTPGPGVTVIDRFTGDSGVSLSTGGISVQSSTFERRVDVPAVADLQEVRVQIAWPAAAGNLDLTVVAPDGSSRSAPAAPAGTGPAANAVKEIVYDGGPAAGTYTIRVRPETYLGTDFHGHVSIRRPE